MLMTCKLLGYWNWRHTLVGLYCFRNYFFIIIQCIWSSSHQEIMVTVLSLLFLGCAACLRLFLHKHLCIPSKMQYLTLYRKVIRMKIF
jgi:hypothetical protein